MLSLQLKTGEYMTIGSDVKTLRRQLDFLFPTEFVSNETDYAPE